MTWIKLDDKTPRHPKIAGLSNLAFRWWVNALCFASEFLTDGVLPRVFSKRVPKQIRAELTSAGLWDFVDPNLVIHGYLEHQQSREAVESERRRQRDRRKGDRGTTDRRTPGTTAGTNGGGTQPPKDADVPEIQKQIAAAPLIKSPAYVANRQRFCAFVGSKIEVPNGLHAELRTAHGGPDPEQELQKWYLQVNDTADMEAWRIPQDKAFYPWFKALYAQKFPAPTVNGTDRAAHLARLQAIERGERKR